VVTTSARPGLSAYRFEKDRFQRYELGDESLFPAGWLPWHQVLAADSRGSWWTGSEHGLLRFLAPDRPGSPVRRQSVLSTADGMPAADVAHVLEDSRGNMWFSTLPIVAYPAPGFRSGFGVWERSTGRIRTFSEADGLPPMNSFGILHIAEDHTGQIWIGLYRTGVARLRQGRFQVFTPADGIPAGGIRFIYEDREHRLWLGSGRGGLGCIADPSAATPAISRYTMADGLSSDEIQAITEDNFGRIYLGTGLGVDRLDPATRGIVHYTAADGLAPGEVQDAVRDSSGDLWFGTYQAVSRLHPRPDPPTRPLPAKVSSVRVNGQAQPVDFTAGQVHIADVPPGSNSVQMDYFAFALSGTENIRYQYRLAGADETWSEPNLSRTTLYSNLRPGSYAFQVRCLNPLPGDPATVRFTVLPHIWERWWFVSLAAMAFLGALYGAHSYRLANILAMQNMRTRLARDLHDDIGSGLSKIVILSEVARRGNGGGPVPEALDHIADTSREVLDAVGDLVWATNATAARIEDLIPRMRSFASQLFEAQGVEFELRVSGTPFGKPLSPEALRQAPLQNGDAFDARHPGQPDIDQGDARRGRFDCRNGLFHRRVQGRDGEPGSAADQYGETLADFADIFDDGNL
jgi:streptogramin lyase